MRTQQALAPAPRHAAPPPPGPALRDARRAVRGLALRQVGRGAVGVLVVVAGLSALVAVQYRTTFSALDAASVQALAENPAVRTLFGPPRALDDPGGFTVWRTGTPLSVLVAVWAALAATRITRGEEDAGRWSLLLAGRATPGAVLREHLAVLTGLCGALGAATAAALVLAGTSSRGAVLHGLSLALLGAACAALGALAAQLAAPRSVSSGLAVGLLAGGLLLKMATDGVPSLSGLRLVTPFGLVAEVQPYAGDRAAPLAGLALAALVLAVAAVVAAAHRDVGAGLLPQRDLRRPRLRLLGSLPGFAVRRTQRPLLAWAVGVGAYYLLIGLLTSSMTRFLADNPQLAALAATAGYGGLGTTEGYAATLLSLLAIPVGAFAATRTATTAAAETSGRLALVLSLPVSRTRWTAAEAAVVAGGCALLTAVAGGAVWAGAAVVGAPLTLPAALSGAVNVLPVALLCLGAAVLALGWAPRSVVALGVLPAAGGYLWQVLGATFGWPAGVTALSPYAHLAPVPSVPADAAGTAGLLGIAAALGALGAWRYARRDLRG